MQPIDPRIEQILSQIDIYQSVAATYGVPAWQAMPIASNTAIAFRPHCSSLEAVWQGSDTVWVWNGQPIYTMPERTLLTPGMALELQAAGICVTGSHAVDVPLVGTDEVFAKFTSARSGAVAQLPDSTTTAPAAPVEDVAPAIATTGFNSVPLVLMVLSLVGLGIGAKFFLRKQPQKAAPKSKPVAPQLPPENDGLDDTAELDYDFTL